MKKIIPVLFVCALFVGLQPQAQTVQNKDPKLVAQKLYQAWHLKNKKTALQIAGKDVVDKLFDVKWRPMKLVSFKRREEGGFECVFRDLKDDWSLAMIIEGGISVGGYNVSSLSFSSEE